ncbi:MAG: hypothetical protein NTZ05_10825 [Chloroflexi bacterium]|nr:hypothetical protein [Chloroflexota bacterium]
MRWPLAWGALALVLASLPYAAAWAQTPPGYEFTGLLVHLPDGFSYLAKMRQGWDGAWLFRLSYSVDSSGPAPIYLFHLLLGHLARLVDLPLIAVYHLARVAAGAALLWALWDLLRFLCPDEPSRRWAYALGCVASGLGWLALPFGVIAPDLSIPEANIFFSLFANPHFPAALAAFAATLSFGFRAMKRRSAGWTAAAAVAALMATTFHPFLAASIAEVLALWVAVGGDGGEDGPLSPGPFPPMLGARGEGRGTRGTVAVFSMPGNLAGSVTRLGIIVAAAALPAALQAAALASDPVLAAWTAQNRTLTPHPPAMVLGYGTPGLLALLGGWTLIAGRRFTFAPDLAVIWLALGVLLLYLPVAFQRRFAEGLQFPLLALAGVGAAWLAGRGPGGRRTVALLLALSIPTTLLNMVVPVLGGARRIEPAYLSLADRAAYSWLAANLTPADVVLAGPTHGNQLPAYTPARVVWGHEFETQDSAVRLAAVRRFFAADPSPETSAFVRAQGVTLVYLGGEEAALGGPAGALLDGARTGYEAGGVRLVRLTPP